MKFVVKKETFWDRKIRKAGSVVESTDKLDEMYPHLFGKSAVSRQLKKTEPVQENKPQTADITLTRG